MYLLQLVQALKYESFSDIQGGLDPGSKRDSQGLSDDSALDRSARHDRSNHQYVNTTNISDVGLFPHLHHAGNFFFAGVFDLFASLKEAAMKPLDIVLQQLVLQLQLLLAR